MLDKVQQANGRRNIEWKRFGKNLKHDEGEEKPRQERAGDRGE